MAVDSTFREKKKPLLEKKKENSRFDKTFLAMQKSNKREFRNTLSLRYNLPIKCLPSHCFCGKTHDATHAMNCKCRVILDIMHTFSKTSIHFNKTSVSNQQTLYFLSPPCGYGTAFAVNYNRNILEQYTKRY